MTEREMKRYFDRSIALCGNTLLHLFRLRLQLLHHKNTRGLKTTASLCSAGADEPRLVAISMSLLTVRCVRSGESRAERCVYWWVFSFQHLDKFTVSNLPKLPTTCTYPCGMSENTLSADGHIVLLMMPTSWSHRTSRRHHPARASAARGYAQDDHAAAAISLTCQDRQ